MRRGGQRLLSLHSTSHHLLSWCSTCGFFCQPRHPARLKVHFHTSPLNFCFLYQLIQRTNKASTNVVPARRARDNRLTFPKSYMFSAFCSSCRTCCQSQGSNAGLLDDTNCVTAADYTLEHPLPVLSWPKQTTVLQNYPLYGKTHRSFYSHRSPALLLPNCLLQLLTVPFIFELQRLFYQALEQKVNQR